VITASLVLYNTAKHQLDRLWESIQQSTVVPHLYVVDNSPKATQHPVFNESRVTYIKTAGNLGYGRGHNIALRTVLKSSEFHFVFNPDIYFGPEELEKMICFMRANGSVGQLMPKVLHQDGSLQYLCKLIPTPADLLLRRFMGGPFKSLLRKRMERFELRFTGYSRIMDVPYLSGCFMLFRVDALRKVGLFDERFFMYPEDIDISRRMNAQFRTVFFPGATIVHDHARDSYKSMRSMWIHIENLVKYFNKWGWIRDSQRSQANRETLKQFEVETNCTVD
jgi:GT2 family glycosyltransferase